MQTIDIEKLMPWGAPVRIMTGSGERIVRKAPLKAGDDFWAIWKKNKQALHDAGVGVGQFNGQWEARWWQPVDPAELKAQHEARLAEQEEIRQALDGTPAVLTPEQEKKLAAILNKLLPYQPLSVRRLIKALTTYKKALETSDTGTGKTYTALAACVVLNRPVFVVCPKAVKPSWKRAAAHFGTQIEVCNYELLRRGEQKAVKLTDDLEDFIWGLNPETIIIFDECHRMKDSKTLNCAMGLAALRQGYTVLGISATAADNPMQMKFAGLVADCFKSEKHFISWMKRNGVTKGRYGLEFDKENGKQWLDQIHRQIFPLHGTRVRIADLGDAFPETQISAECYDTNGNGEKIQAAYDLMQEEIARIEASCKDDATKNACILTEMLRARQRAEVLKVPAIVSMAKDAIEEGMSVAIFVNFDDSADAICRELGTTCFIRGGQSDKSREENIQAFQTDVSPVIVCNIRAGGVGVSLHGNPKSRMRLAIICPTWSGQDLKQALGRVHRAQGAKSIQRIFFAAGTIEERICEQVREKIARIDALNDGDLSPTQRRKLEAEKVIEAPEIIAKKERVEIEEIEKTVEKEQRKRDAMDALATRMTPELTALAHAGLRTLASMDQDHATELNDRGFNKLDNEFGHKLAQAGSLTPRQAAFASKLCNKYRGQLGAEWQPIVDLFKKEDFSETTSTEKSQAVKPAKKADAPKETPVAGSPVTEKAERKQAPKSSSGSSNDLVKAALENKPLTFKQICTKTGLSRGQVRYAFLDKLVRDGYAVKTEDGWKLK